MTKSSPIENLFFVILAPFIINSQIIFATTICLGIMTLGIGLVLLWAELIRVGFLEEPQQLGAKYLAVYWFASLASYPILLPFYEAFERKLKSKDKTPWGCYIKPSKKKYEIDPDFPHGCYVGQREIKHDQIER